MTAGCHLGPFSCRSGSLGIAAHGGGGARQGWSFLGWLHPGPLGLPAFPSSSIAWLVEREGTHSARPGVCPALAPLDGLGEAPNLPGRVSRLGDRGVILVPALTQGATEAQGEDSAASGGSSFLASAQHDHGPQPRKLNSRALSTGLGLGGHCCLGALWRPLETS